MYPTRSSHTIDSLTLDHIVVVAAGQKAVPVASDNAFDVAVITSAKPIRDYMYRYAQHIPIVDIEEEALHLGQVSSVANFTRYWDGP